MTADRPPLYVRRPFVAGLVRQLPLLAVLTVVAVGLAAFAVYCLARARHPVG